MKRMLFASRTKRSQPLLLRMQLENVSKMNLKLIQDECGDAQMAEMSSQLLQISCEHAYRQALTTELAELKRRAEDAIAMKEQQMKEEANVIGMMRLSLERNNQEQTSIKEELRALMVQNSQMKEYGKVEVQSYLQSLDVLKEENKAQRTMIDQGDVHLQQLNDAHEELHSELEAA
ncbi:unnamed protein product, partial [Effrenium voratum]